MKQIHSDPDNLAETIYTRKHSKCKFSNFKVSF